MHQHSGLIPHKANSAAVDSRHITFDSGSRIQLAHVTSIAPVDSSAQLQSTARVVAFISFAVGAAVGSEILGMSGFLIAGILAAWGGYAFVMAMRSHMVRIVSSSSETWILDMASKDAAISLSNDLQRKIAELNTTAQLENNSERAASTSIADELIKLNKLLQDGAITVDEFSSIKSKLLKSA
ncbi:MAG: SHOCT domain-containing protein [Proteobacteria bacterium]|nr:MAG: SHOCT domain-containing protein [Pseudomonadota bacterium]